MGTLPFFIFFSNSFVYKFSFYANSNAPPRVMNKNRILSEIVMAIFYFFSLINRRPVSSSCRFCFSIPDYHKEWDALSDYINNNALHHVVVDGVSLTTTLAKWPSEFIIVSSGFPINNIKNSFSEAAVQMIQHHSPAATAPLWWWIGATLSTISLFTKIPCVINKTWRGRRRFVSPFWGHLQGRLMTSTFFKVLQF